MHKFEQERIREPLVSSHMFSAVFDLYKMNNDSSNEMWSACTFLIDKLQWTADCHIWIAKTKQR